MKLSLAGVGVLVLQTALSANDDFLHQEIASRWLDRNEVEDRRTWAALLEQRFAHLPLGVFDVSIPVSTLRDAKALKETGLALAALLEAQAGWEAWVAGRAPELRKEDPLADWLRGWTPKTFAGVDAHGQDLGELAAPEQELRAALAELRAAMRSGPPLGVERELTGVPIVLFPRRGEFVEFTCVVGALDERQRPLAWQDGLTSWLEFQAGEVRLLTLEYGASDDPKSFDKGIGVGDRNPAAVGQLVVQVATRSLIAHLFANALDPALASGMANALVIDLYGELDTRIDGDVRSRSSQGRSIFVPGGNPNGGVLPPTSAENRWRGSRGKDHFLRILAQVQKQSGRKAHSKHEKLARFELIGDDGGGRELVQAPFLGPSAQRPADEFLPDYLELVRCYGVGFLHWLRVEGAGAESGQRFGKLLQALGEDATTDKLPQLFQQVYGQPLSAPTLDELFAEQTLEGRFLTWLARR
jgi:hypothetical protein